MAQKPSVTITDHITKLKDLNSGYAAQITRTNMQRKTAPVCGSDVSCIVSLVDEKWASSGNVFRPEVFFTV